MTDQTSTSGYKKPLCKKFLTTDEVLTTLFHSGNDSDGSEISFGSETTSSEEFLDLQPYHKNNSSSSPNWRNHVFGIPYWI